MADQEERPQFNILRAAEERSQFDERIAVIYIAAREVEQETIAEAEAKAEAQKTSWIARLLPFLFYEKPGESRRSRQERVKSERGTTKIHTRGCDNWRGQN